MSGSYSCAISDQSGCASTNSLIISQPPNALIAIATVIDSIDCYGDNNGIASISASGGVPLMINMLKVYSKPDLCHLSLSS